MTFPPPHDEAPANILIVEDEGIIADNIASRLRKSGYRVAGIADSSEEALALEYYARFLKAHDRATEADSAEASARAIRRQRVRALAPLEATVSSVFNVGGGVTAPRLLYKVEPEYSEEARANKYQGSFAVKVTIDVDGLAKDPEIVRGLGFGLDEQAILAIARWRFKPGEKDGLPVPVRATIEVNFKLL